MSILLTKLSEQPWEEWRNGVRTRLWAGASTGAKALCIGEQTFEPGSTVPVHWHYAEEIITVLSGAARFIVDGEEVEVEGESTIIYPAQSRHGLVNIGSEPLHIVGLFAWPFYETYWEGESEDVFTRQWEAQADGIRRRLRHDPNA